MMEELKTSDSEETLALIEGSLEHQKQHLLEWRQQPIRRHRLHMLHICLLYTTICTLLFLAYHEHVDPLDPGLAMYSPLNQVVEYKKEITRMHKGLDDDPGRYIGQPSDELDERWTDLYKVVQSIHIPQSDARQIWDPTVPIWNMTGEYLIGVEVFHQLHCLDMLRKAAWPERYNQSFVFPNGTRNDHFTRHFEHCIENLRTALICHSDVTPITFHWQKSKQRIAQTLETPHKCRNFDKIREWAGKRAVPFDDERYPFVWTRDEDHGAVVP